MGWEKHRSNRQEGVVAELRQYLELVSTFESARSAVTATHMVTFEGTTPYLTVKRKLFMLLRAPRTPYFPLPAASTLPLGVRTC